MKKYQQLLIVSLGLVSFICFLIYKHEYDRLRNVLEVLEVFGTPPEVRGGDGNLVASNNRRSHPLDVNHNPALGAGSINELNLGGGNNNAAQQIAYDAKPDDSFVLKNGHGVRPPDNPGDEVGGDKKDGAQNPAVAVQGSGEVMDNMIDDGGAGGGGGVIGGKLGALKKASKKAAQRQQQDSIFKEKLQQDNKEHDNEV